MSQFLGNASFLEADGMLLARNAGHPHFRVCEQRAAVVSKAEPRFPSATVSVT